MRSNETITEAENKAYDAFCLKNRIANDGTPGAIKNGEAIVDYMIHIVNRTRQHPEIELGVSPRGTAALFRATQSFALLDGRGFVIPDDIKRLASPVLAHRLLMKGLRHSGSKDAAEHFLAENMGKLNVPL